MMITTADRLILRQIEESDADFLLALMNEPAYHTMIGDRGLRVPEDARLYCRDILRASYQRHGFGLYLVCLIPTARKINPYDRILLAFW
ncbi:MAG: GNAT family N-acetyltransferase [Cohaesibacter sp.]|nr:GNAT family N-acetyltransferase [Cohaesibacter sp.]